MLIFVGAGQTLGNDNIPNAANSFLAEVAGSDLNFPVTIVVDVTSNGNVSRELGAVAHELQTVKFESDHAITSITNSSNFGINIAFS